MSVIGIPFTEFELPEAPSPLLPSAIPASMTTAIRLARTGAFFDQATVKRLVVPNDVTGGGRPVKNEYGDYDGLHPSFEYTTRCNFAGLSSSESGGAEEAAEGAGRFSLPFNIEATIDQHDRIELTHTGGIALESPRLYTFIGPIVQRLASMMGPVILVTGQA